MWLGLVCGLELSLRLEFLSDSNQRMIWGKHSWGVLASLLALELLWCSIEMGREEGNVTQD